MNITTCLQLLGGIGLFLYGMSLMGSSLEKLAGSGLERILEKLTTSKKKGVGTIKGFGLGTGVTAIIQSSAATTLMLIGFVNAGIMKIGQAIPVVMGANVGSTVTAQILRLGDLGSGGVILSLLKPAAFAPMLVGIGAFITLFTKSKKAKQIAGILVGLGILFYGMTMMEQVFEPLRDSAEFKHAFTSFSNPLLGIAAGLIITAIIQSSSASVGILQALSATGQVTYGIAIPIIIGQNIGKCGATILGGIGANKKAKRVALLYVLFNIFGAIIFTTGFYVFYIRNSAELAHTVNRGNIANIHLLFNLLTSFILLPFSSKLEKLTGKIMKDEDVSKSDKELSRLDDMLLNTPTIALEQCKKVVYAMSDAIYENYKIATSLIYDYDDSRMDALLENENFIDRCESALSAYIVKINSKRLSKDDRLVVSEILNSITDFERMGDHCMNIFYVARDKNSQNIHFTPAGHKEVDTITAACDAILSTTFNAFKNDNASSAIRIEPMAEVIDKLKEMIKSHHVERLQNGTCSIAGGISLVDLITSYERISSHCANISLHIVKRVGNDRNFDEMHGHVNDNTGTEYKALYHYYESLYVEPVINPDVPAPVIEEKPKPSKKDEKKEKKKEGKEKFLKGKLKKEDKKEDKKEAKKDVVKEDVKDNKESVKEAKSEGIKYTKKDDSKENKKDDKKDNKKSSPDKNKKESAESNKKKK